ncbi:hypothetical protein D9757_014655 [Collybiopsis confluens]|uniref:Uncharacterized protein n=1 Tax=Collybiopsis confluens TaxID=2823264 RepID=A0A8H5C7Y8_9AGAR|nr:hypothetical protein D9757_014655 [Collybiopsis confluens]
MPSDTLLNSFPDASLQSLGNPELTLGSLPGSTSLSDFSTPPRPGLRVPSTTSQTTAQSSNPVTTPPPFSGSTPGIRRKLTADTVALDDGDNHIDSLKKENFDIKLRKLLLELEKELERLQRQQASGGGNRAREKELETKLEERDRELRELRRRRESSDHGDAAVRELEARNYELEEELENVRRLLEDNIAEIERLQDIVEDQGEEDVSALQQTISSQAAQLDQNADEKLDLLDEIESLRLTIDELSQRLEAHSLERSQSRAQIMEEREEREAVEGDLNALKDRLAAALIELQQKEDDVDRKDRTVQDLIAEHQKIVAQVEDEWREELEDHKQQLEECRDVLSERDSECKDLRLTVSELESTLSELQSKFEATLAHLESEGEEKDVQIEHLTEALEKLGEQIYMLEDENDKIKEDYEKIREEDDERLREFQEEREMLETALKDKLAALKSQLSATEADLETCTAEIHSHRQRQEELASHVETLVAELESERESRERIEADFDAADAQHADQMRTERRAMEAKESALTSALTDLAKTQSLLTQRDSDLGLVQEALQTLEAESKRAGESHSSAKFSLQLECDRLKRDVERLEDELTRARAELSSASNKYLDKGSVIDSLHTQNRDLQTQLAQETQARLNISEKLDTTLAQLKAAQAELETLKGKLTDLEGRLGKEQREVRGMEESYRDQVTERNTLLLTVWQYLDKKSASQAETKPFTNFSVFHSNLMSRLKVLSQIQTQFEARVKEVEGKYGDTMNEMRKQLEGRWRQVDKFEQGIKGMKETKDGWRRKLSAKEGEIEGLKTTNADLAAQLSGLTSKSNIPSQSMEIRALQTRASTAERRLNNAQNQLLATEEKIAAQNQKMGQVEGKWEARVKEYEARLKAAEERVKRERQGGKERVAELEAQMKTIQRQLELAQKRSAQIQGVIESNKAASVGTGSTGNSPSR